MRQIVKCSACITIIKILCIDIYEPLWLLSRSGGQACHANGKIYLFGGLCSRRRVVVSCEVYDIATDTYDQLTDLPAMILDFGLVLVGDSTVYLIGGMDPITFETKDTVYIYDLKTHKWCHDFPALNVAR